MLAPGESVFINDLLRSKDGHAALRIDETGDVVVAVDGYDTFRLSGQRLAAPLMRDSVLVMQSDGNLVLYQPLIAQGRQVVVWASGPFDINASAVIGEDGAVTLVTSSGRKTVIGGAGGLVGKQWHRRSTVHRRRQSRG
ncbi:MAG: hypothetical protein ABI692_07105 [Terracoccus sp.]